MNSAFKHLESKLRFGDLSIGQWAGVIAGVLIGLAFAQFLSPFGGMWAAIAGVYVAAIPASAALFAGLGEFDLWRLLAGMWRWRRGHGRHLPGAGSSAQGYAVLAGLEADRPGHEVAASEALDALWPSAVDIRPTSVEDR